jgi:hypothetical protein
MQETVQYLVLGTWYWNGTECVVCLPPSTRYQLPLTFRRRKAAPKGRLSTFALVWSSLEAHASVVFVATWHCRGILWQFRNKCFSGDQQRSDGRSVLDR